MSISPSYQVFARKYRPKSFDAVVGQSHIVTTLKNAIKNQTIAHAYLFAGTRGVGKTTCARIFAQAINCLNSQQNDGEPCNTCVSCQAALHQHQYNVIELDAASNNSVENIREWISEARVAPAIGKYKVYILDEAHMLSTQAFNAFLKTLEEPPKHVIFILATTEKNKLLPTILSRCQVLDFVTIDVATIVQNLKAICQKEAIVYEEEALYLVAEKADGSMRDALSIFDKLVAFSAKKVGMEEIKITLQIVDDNYYLESVSLCLEEKTADVILLLDKTLRDGHQIQTILEGFNRCLRNLLVLKDEKTLLLADIYPSLQPSYLAVADRCSFDFIISALSIVQQAMINLRLSDGKRYFVEFLLIQISQINRMYHIVSSEQSIAPKPVKHGLVLPVHQRRRHTNSASHLKNTSATEQSLYISVEDKQPKPKKTSLDSLIVSGQKSPSSSKDIVELIRRQSEQRLIKTQKIFTLSVDEIAEIKQKFTQEFIALHADDNSRIAQLLDIAVFSLDSGKNTLQVVVNTEMDYFYFNKEVKDALHQYFLKKYETNLFIDCTFTERRPTNNITDIISLENQILTAMEQTHPHIYAFIKKYDCQIIV